MSKLESIEHRLRMLENEAARARRTAGRYRAGFTMLLLCVLGLGGLAATQTGSISDVIQTRRLEIVDGSDNLVLALSPGAFGGQLDIWNDEERNLLRLSASARGGDIALWNDDGVNLFGAYASPDGGVLSVWNSEGREVCTAKSKSDGGGRIQLGNSAGKVVATITSIPERGAGFAILNENNEHMVILGAHEHGGAINLFNDRGVPMVVAGFGPDLGSGELSLRNHRGAQIFNVGADDEGGGRITIWNPLGEKPRTFSSLR